MIRGTRYIQLERLEENENGTNPLLLDILNSSEQHFVDAVYGPDVRNLCRRFPEAISCIGKNGKTALHSAVRSLVDGMILSNLLPDGVDCFHDSLLLTVDFDRATPLSNYLQHQADPRVVDLLMDTEGGSHNAPPWKITSSSYHGTGHRSILAEHGKKKCDSTISRQRCSS